MKFILGTKLSMTQVFREDGTVVPVTRVQAGPCTVTQIRSVNGKKSVQVGMGEQKAHRVSKALRGHLKDLSIPKVMREVVIEGDTSLERGDTFTAENFAAGDKVQVSGRSKGRGFQGVVKRHGFAGSPASHGHKDQLRMPGSIGATDAARVFKGTRMGGHMGDKSVTVKNLEVVEVHPETNELYIKGAVPGARGSELLIIAAEGELTAQKASEPEVKEETSAPEAPAEETPVAEAKDASAPEEKQEEEPADVKKEAPAETVEDAKEETPATEAEAKPEETK